MSDTVGRRQPPEAGWVDVLGVHVSRMRRAEVLAHIRDVIAAGGRATVTHVHVMGLNLAYEQPWLRAFFNAADLVYCDGMGVKLGARLLGGDIPERFTLADWVDELAALAAASGMRVYLLGNPPGVAAQAAARLKERHPALQIVGTHHGYFDQSAANAENAAVVAAINAAQPHLLLVGFGMPRQERWLAENRAQLTVNVALTVGALFEYVAGTLPRGPRWLTQHYLEWLARWWLSPRRYTRRYLHDNPLFLARILRQRWAQRRG